MNLSTGYHFNVFIHNLRNYIIQFIMISTATEIFGDTYSKQT